MDKATFQDLITRKLQRDKDQLQVKEVKVSTLGKSLLFKKPSDDALLNVIEEIGDGSNTRKIMEAYKKLIYLTCDLLQSADLQKELQVVDPFDTVTTLFSIPDIMQIGAELVDFAGFGDVGERVKN